MSAWVWSTVTIQSLLDNKTGKWIRVLNSLIRDYPELMYVGLFLPNYFKDGWKFKSELTYAEQKTLSFKNIWALESDMTINANEVTWYEAGMILEEALITANVTVSDNEFVISADKVKHFKVGDVIIKKPKLWGTTPQLQAEITAINTGTNTITLDASTTAQIWDRVLLAYSITTYGAQVARWVSKWDVAPVTTYFQTFGESVSFNSNELNKTYLLESAMEFVKSKFSVAINSSNNRFAKAFYFARNISWTRSETQGLENVIAGLETTYWAGTHIIDFTGITDSKAKVKKLVQTINLFNSAPIYNWVESPTFFVNDLFITNLSELMFDMGNQIPLNNKTIEFGLQSYKSVYFKNVEFIVSHTLNRIEQDTAVAYVFPKHLVTFKTPEYQSVTDTWVLVKTKVWWYEILKMPQVSVDVVEYTAQMRIANVFGWQSMRNTYGKIVNF